MSAIRITPISDEKTTEGTWTKYRGVDLKIARNSNDNFSKKFIRLLKPIKEDYENDQADPKMLEDILCKSLAGTVLTGWKNFIVDEKPLPFTEENAAELLKQDPDCRSFVQKFSQQISNYLADEEVKVKAKL